MKYEMDKSGTFFLFWTLPILLSSVRAQNVSTTLTVPYNVSSLNEATVTVPNIDNSTNHSVSSLWETLSTTKPTVTASNESAYTENSQTTLMSSTPMQDMVNTSKDYNNNNSTLLNETMSNTTDEANTPTPTLPTVLKKLNLTLEELPPISVYEEVHVFKPPPPPIILVRENSSVVNLHPDPGLSVILETPPFDRVRHMFPDFQSQTIALHTELCGSTCHFSHQNARRRFRARACSECFCDSLCHVYGDCCPDVQLLYSSAQALNFSMSIWKDMEEISRSREIYTCEITHLKRKRYESDYNNYFSMINYCPRNITSRTSTVQNSAQASTAEQGSQGTESEQHQRQWLEEQCENRANSSHWHYLRPWTSREGVVYRNQFCAQCHGHDPRHLTPWSTSVKCDPDLLRSATSVKEAYFLAANTPGCDIRFTANLQESLRRCTSLRPPIITSCNETGLWRNYDDKIARACASFTAPVKKKYKNAFCYLCNHDLTFYQAQYELSLSADAANIARLSFFALLDMDEAENEDVSIEVSKEVNGTLGSARGHVADDVCETGSIRDPLQCHCRDVKCGEGLRVKGDNCSQLFSRTNYFGYEVCARFQIKTQDPIPDTPVFENVFHSLTFLLGGLTTRFAEAYPRLDCEDKTRGTIDARVKVFSYSSVPLKQMADSFHQSLKNFESWWTTDSAYNISVVAPALNCVTMTDWLTAIPDACSTINDTIAMGVRSGSGLLIGGMGQIEVHFATLYNTTFCPHVNLTEAEFRNYTEKLEGLNLTEANVTMDTISTENSTLYLICVEDYLLVDKATDTCSGQVINPGKNESVTGFQDTWTPLGVISTVCTCVSLVCLLAVIVTYLTLSPLRAGSGQCTLAMACVLFVAQALHEVGLEQFDVPDLCVVLALLIHIFWLSAVFMMTSCTLQLFLSIRFPLKTKMALSSRKVLVVSLLSAFGLSAAIVGITILSNQVVYGDLGYPAKYICFIRRRLSRQLSFGLPLGLAVFLNILLFLLAILHLHRRPNIRCSRQDRVSLAACFRLSVVTGACWLSLFLLEIPGTRPWLEYAFVVLLGLQGFLLATTLLLNKRVFTLWKDHFNHRRNARGSSRNNTFSGSSSEDTRQDYPAKTAVTTFTSSLELSSSASSPIVGKKAYEQC